MPQYHFRVFDDGEAGRDLDGSFLPDVYSAQHEAVRMGGDMLRDLGARLWELKHWRMEVADVAGIVLFTLRVVAEDGPGLSPVAVAPLS